MTQRFSHTLTIALALSFFCLLTFVYASRGNVKAYGRLAITAPSVWATQDGAFSLPEAKVGAAYEFQFQTEGGLAPLKWSVASGALPPGLRLDEQGKLSGTPAQAKAEAYAFVVEVSDSAKPPQRFSLPFLLMVQAAPLRILTKAAPPLRIITQREAPPQESVEKNHSLNNEPDTLMAEVSARPPVETRVAVENPSRLNALPMSARINAAAPVTAPAAQNKRLDQPLAGKPITGVDEPNKPLQLFVNEDEKAAKLKTAEGTEADQITTAADGSFKAEPVAPLSAGQRVALKIGGAASPLFFVTGERDDERENLEASFYTGLAIDSFAASRFKGVLNRNDASGVKERFIGGFDFAYRLFGDPSGKDRWQKKNQQLWIYGETLHGVRSADVDCSGANPPPVCDPFNVGSNPTGRFTYILRNATSLEGHAGLRWEFATLNKGLFAAARPYLKAEAGFLSVTDVGDDMVDMHKLALGMIVTKGLFQNSYLEAGLGRTDLFLENRRRRLKVDGYLSWDFGNKGIFNWLRPFAQITIDSDLRRGSDSIQSYYGFDFNLKCLFNPAGCHQ